MRVAAGIIATGLVVLLVLVAPIRGKRRYLALVERVRSDPRARIHFYVRGVIAECCAVAVVGLVGVLASRGPSSIRLTWHLRSSGDSVYAVMLAVVTVIGIGVSVRIIRRASPGTINSLRKQVRGFVELLPRTTQERRTFVAVAVSAGVCEEIVFRGFGLAYVKWLAPGASSLVVVLIIGAAFGVGHAYQGPRGIVLTGVLGGLFAWLTIVTGSLLPAMVVHTVIDLRPGLLPSSITEPYEAPDADPASLGGS